MVRKMVTSVTGKKPGPEKKTDASADFTPAYKPKKVVAKVENPKVHSIKRRPCTSLKSRPRLGRTRRCLKQWLNSLNTDTNFYIKNASAGTELYLPAAKGIRKISKTCLIDFNLLFERLARSYVSRGCVLAHTVKQCNAVTPDHLHTVDNFFMS